MRSFPLFLALVFTVRAFADGTLMSWSGRDLEGASQESFDAAKRESADAVLRKNKRVTTWPEAYHLLIGANEHRNDKQFLSALIEQLGDTTEHKLENTGRLIIWERITSGDIVFEGKGLQVSDDLFTVAGRANWFLRTITNRDFGHVTPRISHDELLRLQNRWKQWLAGKDTPNYQDPYASSETGLEEIRSLAALEALIVSLRPGSAKAAMTANCLRQAYGLDALPADPAHPARLCSPDTYVHGYLAKLTDVKDSHDPQWWKEWWARNGASLEWDAEAARFRVPAK